jgi:hypothetical protein
VVIPVFLITPVIEMFLVDIVVPDKSLLICKSVPAEPTKVNDCEVTSV